MKATIFILSWTSYTDSDDYLYTDIKTFTDEDEARKQYGDDCQNAHDECVWGSQWDEPEDERDEDCKYDIDESALDDCYTVSSSAYDGYKVEVKLEKQEIDIPLPSNCLQLKKGIGDMMHWQGDDGKKRTTKVTGVQAYRYSNPQEVEENSCYQTYVQHKGTRQVAWVDESDIIS